MLNILIISNKLKFIKRLTNSVLNNFDFVKIIGIIGNFNELVSFELEKTPDFIFSDSNILNKKVNYDVVYISESMSDEEILYQIEPFLKSKNESYLREAIVKILIDLKFNLSLVGSKFLIESILYSFINKYSDLIDNLEGIVYPFVAKKYKIDVSNVKWSIIRAINYMFLEHNTTSVKYLSDYFHIDYLKKPTPKIVITTIVNKLY